MRGELAIGDKVSVHVRDAYHIYGTIEGIIVDCYNDDVTYGCGAKSKLFLR